MKSRTPALAAAALGAGLLFAVAAPLSASAHVEVTPDATAAGGYSVLTFSLPHGCDGSPTTSLAIHIPESIISVTPTVNPGWTVSKVTEALAKPITDGDDTITEHVGQVVYTAKDPLPADLRDTFALSLPLPKDAAGKTLEFPVTQTCEQGSVEWNEKTPEGGDEPEHPAPAITVTAATGDEHGGSEHSDDATASSSTTDAAAQPDVLARVLGIAGLVVGVIGVVIAVASRRRAAAK
ncbi:YcnI family protein [Rathayibacter sp. YIM 133350]|uniref:YcnI family copper-binding membrane protein n=1 Tax=Rathayibacter sp. YIM 133350 TaxID=3131992 RepID=UPI00307D072F